MPELAPGTEVEVVAAGGDYWLQLSSVCTRVADAIRFGQIPLDVRSCDLQYDWSPTGIIGNEYVGTWTVAPTVPFGTPGAVADMLAGAIRTATGQYPAEVGVARVGGIRTSETLPADPPASVIGGIGDFLTTLTNALPWLVIGILALAVFLIVTLARSPEGRKAALKFV